MQTDTIQLLSDHVANKIAAGEVIERPASVVKELVENSLDAGARNIVVSVVDGGKKLVSVADDGRGMSRDNLLLSIERHATSKILEVDDIEAIETMGFRGEALAAVGSVSRMTITSRRNGDLGGHELRINGGRLQDLVEIGCPVGTRIEIRTLFYNVPARRKFLRTDQTELSHIRNIFLLLALANPAVGLRLIVDEREIHNLPPGQTLEDRLLRLYNADLARRLRPLHAEEEGCRVHGCIGEVGLHRADRTDIQIFVNRRPASAAAIHAAIRDACRGVFPRDRHPVLFLFIDLDPGQVDVNVHPAKREIRLRKPSQVSQLIVEAIQQAFNGPMDAPSDDDTIPEPAAPPPQVHIEDLPELPILRYPRWTEPPGQGVTPREAFLSSMSENPPLEAAQGSEATGPWRSCRMLGVIGGRWVLLETEEGLVTMNPRAAQERVVYENMLALEGEEVAVQGLLTPETVSLTAGEATQLRACLRPLTEMGVGISDFGGDCFIVDALPVCLGTCSAERILREVLEELDGSAAKGRGAAWIQDHMARAAARASVQGRKNYALSEIEALVRDLARCDLPYTSPSGKPTLILTSNQELKRKFGVE